MFIVYILIAILMFGVLIAIHEFGHFAAAKLLGVRVNEFAIGMGPRILHRKKGETEYTWRLFPIGGFCAMEGEEEASDDPRAFNSKPAWKRFLILAAGAFMNFVLGVVIFLFLFAGQQTYLNTTVDGFVNGFTAQGEQGLMPGDRILEIDGHKIWLQSDIRLFFSRGNKDETLDFVVERGGAQVVLNDLHMPWMYAYDAAGNQLFNEDGSPYLIRGVTFAQQEAGLLDKLQLTWYTSIDTVRLVWISLGDLVTGAVGVRDMSGPVGIVSMIGDEATQAQQQAQEAGTNGLAAAARSIFYIVAFIAVNLAVMNLLPIPALDGGQILFLLVDKVYGLFTKRRIDQKYLGYINGAGFLLLIGLMVVVAVSDVMKLMGR